MHRMDRFLFPFESSKFWTRHKHLAIGRPVMFPDDPTSMSPETLGDEYKGKIHFIDEGQAKLIERYQSGKLKIECPKCGEESLFFVPI